MINKETETLLL